MTHGQDTARLPLRVVSVTISAPLDATGSRRRNCHTRSQRARVSRHDEHARPCTRVRAAPLPPRMATCCFVAASAEHRFEDFERGNLTIDEARAIASGPICAAGFRSRP